MSDVDLASRLSFFLWSSIPDERLLDLATSGRLRQPGVLAAEVKRMIKDKRADALINNFTGQWLQLRNLEAKVSPDLLMFPDFDDNVRKGFRRETEMLFGYILRNDRSALELLSADYTFLNERLAKNYGIPGVYGERFRQVKLTDPNRFGLLGHGSILSLTALATRTSPVFRGKYVLSTFLDTPPPPPPPNVPTLEDSNKGADSTPKSVRDQLELHRKNPACASCHRAIDPRGFRARKLQLGRAVAQRHAQRRKDRRRRRAGRRIRGQRAGPTAAGHSQPARRFRHPDHQAYDDLCTGAWPRAGRYAGGAQHRQTGGAEQLPPGYNRQRHHSERTIPDADAPGSSSDGQHRGPTKGRVDYDHH